MLSSIKTSKANKELVTQLTNKLNLGAENVIAKLAFAYSLAEGKKLDINQILDSTGKEYSIKVLFGEYSEYYIALVCVHYNLFSEDKDISKYIKMHLDDGLQLINFEIKDKYSISGNDFIVNQIEKGLRSF